MERHAQALLERGDLAPAAARDFVTQVLIDGGHAECATDAALLVDELVLNALEHVTHGLIRVDVRSSEHGVHVDVSDPEPDFVEDHGRPGDDVPRLGLRIVDTLASRWGVATSPSGKSVWFELDRARGGAVCVDAATIGAATIGAATVGDATVV